MSYTNQRIAYGDTLVKLGKENPNIVVLDADLGGSTMGKMFEQAYPKRHYEMGIAGLHRPGKFRLLIHLRFFREEEHMTRSGRQSQ